MTIYQENNWDALRWHYDLAMPEIMDVDQWVYGIDPYAWEEPFGMVNMTPIERLMWCDIRQTGIVMYPQFPVLNFFLDFANPIAKVAIECDGKEFHDRKKDEERDARLRDIGWTVYRLTGSEIVKQYPDDDLGHSVPNYSELACRHIAEKHKLSGRYADERKDKGPFLIGDLIPAYLDRLKMRMQRAKAMADSGKYRYVPK